MAENRINISLLAYSAMDKRTQGSYCIAGEDSDRLNQLLANDPDLKEAAVCKSPLGSVSLFPHKFSLNFFGCLMHVFGKSGLPMYGMAASLSALTLTTDFHLLDRAIESDRAAHKPSPEPCTVWPTTQDKVDLAICLPGGFELETIAVYWENRIKTYGLQIERELSLFQISVAPQSNWQGLVRLCLKKPARSILAGY